MKRKRPLKRTCGYWIANGYNGAERGCLRNVRAINYESNKAKRK